MRDFLTLLLLAALAFPALADTSPAYRKDALALLKIQQQVLLADQAGKVQMARSIERIAGKRLLKFSKRYQNYRPGGLIPASNALLGTSDGALHQLVWEKDAAKKKQLSGQAGKTLADLRRFIEQGK